MVNYQANQSDKPTYLSLEDSDLFSQLLLERYGLNFSETRRSELEIAVMQSFAASTFNNLRDYYDFLQTEVDGGAELERLVNVATINETHFFRDAGQFDALVQHVLPELIKRRRSLRTLRLWSAGCASGEEPYSLAILLHEMLPDLNDWAITILGTDINTSALDRARRAVYGSWSFREEKAKLLRDRYFQQVGNRWELIPEIRRMVTFSRLNLATPDYPSYETNTNFIDLILCRNVLIYLGESTAKNVVNRLFESLQAGGWLVVAPSEGAPELFRRFQARTFPSAILYQRMSQTAVLRQEKSHRRAPTAPLKLPVTPVKPAPSRSQTRMPAMTVSQSPTLPAPPVEEQNLLEQAQDLIAFGHSEQAQEILLKLTRSRFIQDKVSALLGQVFANRGDWDQAERWCSQAIRQNRLSLDAYYTLSLVLQHQGKLDQAVEAMRKVIYLDHSDVLGHFGLANLYYEGEQYPRALKSLDNALHLMENKPPDDLIPRSSGMTISRLREAIVRQQQHWNALMADI